MSNGKQKNIRKSFISIKMRRALKVYNCQVLFHKTRSLIALHLTTPDCVVLRDEKKGKELKAVLVCLFLFHRSKIKSSDLHWSNVNCKNHKSVLVTHSDCTDQTKARNHNVNEMAQEGDCWLIRTNSIKSS